MREILFLNLVFKEMIWGGDRLYTQFNYNIPSSHISECWAVSAHTNGDCTIKSGTRGRS
jgi:mannose-6-phosphate isomerase